MQPYYFKETGIREIAFELPDESVKNLNSSWKYYVERIDDYPDIEYNGRGIVFLRWWYRLCDLCLDRNKLFKVFRM